MYPIDHRGLSESPAATATATESESMDPDLPPATHKILHVGFTTLPESGKGPWRPPLAPTPAQKTQGNTQGDSEKNACEPLNCPPNSQGYSHAFRHLPAKSFVQQLQPFHGRLNDDNWFKVLFRPFVLFAYPAVLWSAVVYSLSIGWLIIASESMSLIFRNPETYNFTAFQTGLVYLSPFIGGILGTLVSGRASDFVAQWMAKRNGGLYEPEFRLTLAIPIFFTTCLGLISFGWTAQDETPWIGPTLCFGILSFGCSLGSTTAIAFCVDSYRQYAGEALVTLNFTKNILHGLIFSIFITNWITVDGTKLVYIWVSVIHGLLMLTTIPMYIYGKRARMWTVKMNFMEKF